MFGPGTMNDFNVDIRIPQLKDFEPAENFEIPNVYMSQAKSIRIVER